MASPALSPSLSNNTGGIAVATEGSAVEATQTASGAVKTAALPTITLRRTEPPKTLRGLNKPKCIKCGNVARSRCPYQSCKSCCSKAQNPCHIHVLKPNATLADRSSSGSTIPGQPINETPSPGLLHKTSSVRQLSSKFAQFNSVNAPLRLGKPLTRKDALAINKWRFSKLKEFRERNIEAENEAFGRYMQNVSLLEEVFIVSSEDAPALSDLSLASYDKRERTSLGLRVKLRSNPKHTANRRKRIQHVVERALKKLEKWGTKYGINDVHDGVELNQSPRMPSKELDVKALVLQDLNDMLNKARNEDDLKSCIQMMPCIKSQQSISEMNEAVDRQIVGSDSARENGSDALPVKLMKMVKIDQDSLNAVDAYFSSLEEIDDL